MSALQILVIALAMFHKIAAEETSTETTPAATTKAPGDSTTPAATTKGGDTTIGGTTAAGDSTTPAAGDSTTPAAGDSTTPAAGDSTTPAATTTGGTTTTTTGPTTPTTLFACVDDSTSSCQASIKKDKNYCEQTNPNYAFARSSCCNACAMYKGFTTKKPKKENKNGVIVIVYVTVVDLTGPAALAWAKVPKVNQIYPGLSKAQTENLCAQRAAKYGTDRFCADKYARCVCGLTCAAYN